MSKRSIPSALGAALDPRPGRKHVQCAADCDDCKGRGFPDPLEIEQFVRRTYPDPDDTERRMMARVAFAGVRCPSCKGTGDCPRPASSFLPWTVTLCRTCATKGKTR